MVLFVDAKLIRDIFLAVIGSPCSIQLYNDSRYRIGGFKCSFSCDFPPVALKFVTDTTLTCDWSFGGAVQTKGLETLTL